jgi:hypothetical protein
VSAVVSDTSPLHYLVDDSLNVDQGEKEAMSVAGFV